MVSLSQMARIGFACVMLVTVAGCGSEPPGCADAKTLSLVVETFWSSVGKLAVEPRDKRLLEAVKPKFEVTLQSPRVEGKRTDAGKALCAGTLKVALTPAASQAVDKLFKRGTDADVEYSSQVTADGKEHLVELGGHRSAVEYVWSLAQMAAFDAAPGVIAPAVNPSIAPSPAASSAPVQGRETQGGVQAAPAPAAPASR